MNPLLGLIIGLLVVVTTFVTPVQGRSSDKPQDPGDQTLFTLPDSSDFFAPEGFESTYTCPPCGCSGDGTFGENGGFCQACGMVLIHIPNGGHGKVARALSGFFRDSFWTGVFYQKFLYPAYVLGLLMGLLLIMGFGGRPGNAFLGMIVLSLALYAFQHQLFGVSYGLTMEYDFLFFPISFITVIGPALYFYLIKEVYNERRFTVLDGMHFAPAILIFGLYGYLFLQADHVKHAFLVSPLDIGFAHYEQALAMFQVLGYGFAGHRLVIDKNRINQKSGSFRLQGYQRLYWLLILLFVGLGCIMWINFRYYSFGVAILTYYPLWFLIALFLYGVIIQLLVDPKSWVDSSSVLRRKYPKYTRNLTQQEIANFVGKLQAMMESQKPFLDPNLNLPKLGDLLGLNPKDLTIVLNSGLEMNFYDFVNEYRVREVKDRLLDPKNRHFTNLAIANDSGFNSKSSFNSIFKKYENMTPSQFKKSYNQRTRSSLD